MPVGPDVGLAAIDGVIVNSAFALLPRIPVADTSCTPLDDAGAWNLAVKLPAELVVIVDGLVETWTPSSEMVIVALALKPLPVTPTCVPTLPEVGLSVMARLIVNEPLALLLLPSAATIVCAPAVDAGAAKLAVKLPDELDVAVLTCPSSYVTVMGEFAAKPVPVTVICVPVVPEVGLRVRAGATVNAACALPVPTFPDASLAATVCGPAVDVGVVNTALKPPEGSEVIVAGVVVTGEPP